MEYPSLEIQWQEIEKLRKSVHDMWNKVIPLGLLLEDITELRKEIKSLAQTISDFHLVRKIVYSAVGLILFSVISSLIYLVVRK